MRPNSGGPGRSGTGQGIRRHRRPAGLLAALTVAMLAAAACSSVGKSPSTSGSATGTASAGITGKAAPASDIGITPTTIRVAMIADVNNSLEPGLFQKSVSAVKAWATIVNDSGGLAGRKVVVDFCDSQLNPNTTSNCVIKACQSDFAMVGTSANALEDLSDIDTCKNAAGQPAGIPNLPAFAFLPLGCDPDTYGPAGLGPYCATANQSPSTYVVPVGDARYLAAHNKNLHGIWLYDTDDPTFKITELPDAQAESNAGIKKDGQGFYALSGFAPQSALTPFIQQIKSSGSTFVYSNVTSPTMVLLRREAQLQGVSTVKVWECNSGCYDPSFYQQGGPTVNGTYAMLLDLPYLSDYKANPALDRLVTTVGGVANVNNNAVNSYVDALLFQDVVQKVVASGKPLNRANFFAAIKTEHAFDADGIIGPTDIGNHIGPTCEVIVQLQNGVWKRVFPTKPGTLNCAAGNNVTIKMTVK